MTIPTLNDLVTPITPEQALATELTQAALLGLDTTAWQPVQPARTILAINAAIISAYSSYVNQVAKGGFASYAATLTDSNGAPITSWLDLVSQQVYATTRIPATYAAGSVTITNASVSTYGPFAPGQLIVSNPTTGAQYGNDATVTLAPGSTTVAVTALLPGTVASSAIGQITALVTPLVGVSCTNAAAFVGDPAESNAGLLARDLAKLGTLSPNGPSQAYYAVATGILDPTQPWYDPALSAPITRCVSIPAPGLVQTYIANAAGTTNGGDLAIVNTEIQIWAVPLGTTATVAWANPVAVNIAATVYVPASAGLSPTQVTAACTNALAAYIETLPIGGVTGATANIVPYSELLATIARAVPTTSVTLSAPASDVSLAVTDVATLGSVSITTVTT